MKSFARITLSIMAIITLALLARVVPGQISPEAGITEPAATTGDKDDLWEALAPDDLPLVLTSIYVLEDLVATIGGDLIAVQSLLPAGADPHSYELRPSQVAAAESAHLLMGIGMALDPFMDRLAAATQTRAVLTKLGDYMPHRMLITSTQQHGHAGHDHGSFDPHVWLDPTLVRDFVLPWLVDALCALDPQGEDEFIGNAARLAVQLNELDQWAWAQLQPFTHKGLITVHRAWDYFGRRYGLSAWALEVAHGVEPSPRYIVELLELAGQRGIQTLFREPHTPESGLTALVQSFGGRVMIIDPLGGPGLSGYDSYLELMRTNVTKIVQGLSIQ